MQPGFLPDKGFTKDSALAWPLVGAGGRAGRLFCPVSYILPTPTEAATAELSETSELCELSPEFKPERNVFYK